MRQRILGISVTAGLALATVIAVWSLMPSAPDPITPSVPSDLELPASAEVSTPSKPARPSTRAATSSAPSSPGDERDAVPADPEPLPGGRRPLPPSDPDDSESERMIEHMVATFDDFIAEEDLTEEHAGVVYHSQDRLIDLAWELHDINRAEDEGAAPPEVAQDVRDRLANTMGEIMIELNTTLGDERFGALNARMMMQ